MRSIKPENWKYGEVIGIGFVYLILILNTFLFKDSLVAVLSAVLIEKLISFIVKKVLK